MPQIHPKTLKMRRQTKNLSQNDLAAASGVSAKQISRLEQGNALKRCNAATADRLAAALKCSVSELAQEPKKELEAELHKLGLKRTYLFLSERDRLNYRFIEHRYGVSPHTIQDAAPLLFVLVAEMHLQARREKLAALEEALGLLSGHGLEHLHDVSVGLSRALDGLESERNSIEACDLAGKSIPDDAWFEFHEGSGDLFAEFLDSRLRELAPDISGYVSGNGASLDYHLFEAELEHLSNNNPLAELVLERGDVHPKDIPRHLLGSDQDDERAAWLAERCSKETRRIFEGRSMPSEKTEQRT